MGYAILTCLLHPPLHRKSDGFTPFIPEEWASCLPSGTSPEGPPKNGLKGFPLALPQQAWWRPFSILYTSHMSVHKSFTTVWTLRGTLLACYLYCLSLSYRGNALNPHASLWLLQTCDSKQTEGLSFSRLGSRGVGRAGGGVRSTPSYVSFRTYCPCRQYQYMVCLEWAMVRWWYFKRLRIHSVHTWSNSVCGGCTTLAVCIASQCINGMGSFTP